MTALTRELQHRTVDVIMVRIKICTVKCTDTVIYLCIGSHRHPILDILFFLMVKAILKLSVVRPSVHPSVRPSVRRFVGSSVRLFVRSSVCSVAQASVCSFVRSSLVFVLAFDVCVVRIPPSFPLSPRRTSKSGAPPRGAHQSARRSCGARSCGARTPAAAVPRARFARPQ